MTRRRIFTGGAFEDVAGYARAVVDEEWVFVSGTTGYDYATGAISDDPVEQTRQCFRNISWALGEAGASLEDVVRVVAYVVDPDSFDDIAKVFGEHFRDIRPANTTVVSRLLKPEMKIEIEVTARRRVSRPPLGRWLVDNVPRGSNLEIPARRDSRRKIPFRDEDAT